MNKEQVRAFVLYENMVLTMQNKVDKSINNPEVNGKWELPGGGLKTGETIDQCIDRELKQEVGLMLFDYSTQKPHPDYALKYLRLGQINFPINGKEGIRNDKIHFIYALVKNDKISFDPQHDHIKCGWMSLDEEIFTQASYDKNKKIYVLNPRFVELATPLFIKGLEEYRHQDFIKNLLPETNGKHLDNEVEKV